MSGVLATVLLDPELFGLDNIIPFVMFVSFRPAAAAALLLSALVAVAVQRRWWPAAMAVSAVAVVTAGFVVLSRALPGPQPSPNPALTVLSFNVYDGHADVAALAHTIETEHPDLVVLPEAGEHYRRLLAAKVSDLRYNSWTTGRSSHEDVTGIVVLTAPRLGTVTEVTLHPGAKFRWMEITGGALGVVRVVGVHAAAPVPGWTKEWISDIEMLRRWCRSDGRPTILVGDFNATLDHSLLRSNIDGCTDAAAGRGQGLVATWPSYFPRWFGVQIDHVFTSDGLLAGSLQVLDLPGSDHRALLARIILPPVQGLCVESGR